MTAAITSDDGVLMEVAAAAWMRIAFLEFSRALRVDFSGLCGPVCGAASREDDWPAGSWDAFSPRRRGERLSGFDVDAGADEAVGGDDDDEGVGEDAG